ncbi:Ku protein, partial [Streptomyces sp. NPDC055144]
MDAPANEDIPKDVATDRYTEAITHLINAKEKGQEPRHAEAEVPAPAVIDLVAALEQSVPKATASRGEGKHATIHDMPKKKTAAKKSTAKKTTGKKAPARRTP